MIFVKVFFGILLVLAICVAILFWVNNQKEPSWLGVHDGKLAPCSSKPNCVSSQSDHSEHTIAPLNVSGIDHPLKKIKSIVLTIPKTQVVSEHENYLHVTFRSKHFSFIDDTEFYYDKDREVVHVRSGARVGYSDLGVNRKRVEWIRTQIQDMTQK